MDVTQSDRHRTRVVSAMCVLLFVSVFLWIAIFTWDAAQFYPTLGAIVVAAWIALIVTAIREHACPLLRKDWALLLGAGVVAFALARGLTPEYISGTTYYVQISALVAAVLAVFFVIVIIPIAIAKKARLRSANILVAAALCAVLTWAFCVTHVVRIRVWVAGTESESTARRLLRVSAPGDLAQGLSYDAPTVARYGDQRIVIYAQYKGGRHVGDRYMVFDPTDSPTFGSYFNGCEFVSGHWYECENFHGY